MKNPEQVRRIEQMAAAQAALECLERTYLVAARALTLTLPALHHVQQAMMELHAQIDKVTALCNEQMAYFKKVDL